LKIININDDRYVICGTVSADKVTNKSAEFLKKKYSLADSVLRRGDTLYICMKIINGEYEDLK
tara:strand:+ start:841 stop:1029 length:189 start_codon:yes stop_codon:yes gene_type:complete